MRATARNRAARLYSLAVIAHLDGGDTLDETAVIARAAYDARKALAAEGYEPRELVTLPQCIAAAKREMGKAGYSGMRPADSIDPAM